MKRGIEAMKPGARVARDPAPPGAIFLSGIVYAAASEATAALRGGPPHDEGSRTDVRNRCSAGARSRRRRPSGDRPAGRRWRLLAGAQPGPEGHPRLGARVRRGCRAPRGARVGRARADAVADHPGGRENRALWLRGPGAVLRRPDRVDAADRKRGAVLGRCGDRHVDHGDRARGRRDLWAGDGRADRRVDTALLRHPG